MNLTGQIKTNALIFLPCQCYFAPLHVFNRFIPVKQNNGKSFLQVYQNDRWVWLHICFMLYYSMKKDCWFMAVLYWEASSSQYVIITFMTNKPLNVTSSRPSYCKPIKVIFMKHYVHYNAYFQRFWKPEIFGGNTYTKKFSSNMKGDRSLTLKWLIILFYIFIF